jgi:hypothetical protein
MEFSMPDTFACNHETFISFFDSETNAIDYILAAHADGRVETTEYTIPYYTYNRFANPPRFIAYGDHQPQTHHYEVRIQAPKTVVFQEFVIEFPVFDSKAMDWFMKHLTNRLSDGWGEFESEEINITDPIDLECSALALQREMNLNRVYGLRTYITEHGADMLQDQFERNCRDLVDLLDENRAITERILELNNIQSIA